MAIDAGVLSSITTAVTVLAQEYAKGLCSEAGKAAWSQLRRVFGWQVDPPIAEIPATVTQEISRSPDLAYEVVGILQANSLLPSLKLAENVNVAGGKVIIANHLRDVHM